MMPSRGYEIELDKDDYGAIFVYFNTGKIKSQLKAQIDTGSSGENYFMFPIKFLKKLKPELNCKLVKARVGGVFGTQKSFISRLATFELWANEPDLQKISEKFPGQDIWILRRKA